jgi:hypothetical protein
MLKILYLINLPVRGCTGVAFVRSDRGCYSQDIKKLEEGCYCISVQLQGFQLSATEDYFDDKVARGLYPPISYCGTASQVLNLCVRRPLVSVLKYMAQLPAV